LGSVPAEKGVDGLEEIVFDAVYSEDSVFLPGGFVVAAALRDCDQVAHGPAADYDLGIF
jgi:hypothetical protein